MIARPFYIEIELFFIKPKIIVNCLIHYQNIRPKTIMLRGDINSNKKAVSHSDTKANFQNQKNDEEIKIFVHHSFNNMKAPVEL